jgi:hypothetical protein
MTTRDRGPRRGPYPTPGRPWDAAEEPLRRWESSIERQIREAQEAGAFDALPYQGEPLPPVDDAYAGEQAAGFRILRNAGVAPGWIEADKDARRHLDERDRLFERAARTGLLSRRGLRHRLEEVVRAYNAVVLRLNHDAPSDAQHRRSMDLGRELAHLDSIWRDIDATRR